jgi:YD repeat-containing protein
LSRKVIEWGIFAIVAVGAVLLVRRAVPWAAYVYYRATAKAAVKPALRRRLREAENRLTAEHGVILPGQSGVGPCLVVNVAAGVGRHGGVSPERPIRDCLELAPGGPPVNAIELDLRTDTLILVQTDMYLPGDPPIAFTRVVEPLIRWNRQFQIFLQNEYDIFPFGHRFPFTYQKLQLADRREILFPRISHGTGYADAVFEHETGGAIFRHALTGWNGDGWDTDLGDGKTFVFPSSYNSTRPPQGALVGLIEHSGNRLTLKRGRNGNLQSARSSDGRWMKVGYRGASIVSLEDSAGEKANYAYDSVRLLASSTNARGERLSYSYDPKGDLTAVWDAETRKDVIEACYGRIGAITSLWVGGRVFGFSYGIDPTGSYADVGVKEKGVGDWVVQMGRCTANDCNYRVRRGR